MLHLKRRANTTLDWYGYDIQARYQPIMKDGFPNLYKPGSFNYKFNDCGFRCDNFSLATDLPIVFLGCSFTEGVGLPLEETWSYKLIEKIREKTNKNIPYWSLAVGGSGIDTAARLLYEFTKTQPVKHIFLLAPPPERREYQASHSFPIYWLPMANMPPLENGHFRDSATGEVDRRFDHTDIGSFNRVFSTQFYSEYLTRKNLMMLDLVSQVQDATIMTSSWRKHSTLTKLYDEFPRIKYFDLPDPHHTKEFTQTEVARDNTHVGPIWHTYTAGYYWDQCKHLF
jgi:hypothetical protein